jgi:predicted phosphohydrolase
MNNLRIVCLSDTHGLHRNVIVPDGDLLIHGGDFSGEDHSLEAVLEFDRWLAELPHACKLVIPGNHEFALEEHPAPHSLFRSATLLINEEIGSLGLRIWGSPVTPLYGGAFGRSSRLDRQRLYSAIPDGIDILVTHGPPYGVFDLEAGGGHGGCPVLLAAVADIKPKLHIFGHIHGSYGLRSDPQTAFANASLLGLSGQLQNEPIIFELENPNHSRQENSAWTQNVQQYG